MGKKQDKKQKHLEQRLKRLMARLTLLNETPPQFGWSEHRAKTWTRERTTILRQLRRHGIEVGG